MRGQVAGLDLVGVGQRRLSLSGLGGQRRAPHADVRRAEQFPCSGGFSVPAGEAGGFGGLLGGALMVVLHRARQGRGQAQHPVRLMRERVIADMPLHLVGKPGGDHQPLGLVRRASGVRAPVRSSLPNGVSEQVSSLAGTRAQVQQWRVFARRYDVLRPDEAPAGCCPNRRCG
ncbi:MAG TPA: hypothetical protein VGI05_10640 [Streptosporangiaceae bacterium]